MTQINFTKSNKNTVQQSLSGNAACYETKNSLRQGYAFGLTWLGPCLHVAWSEWLSELA